MRLSKDLVNRAQRYLRDRSWLPPLVLALLGTVLVATSVQRYKRDLGYGMQTETVLTAAVELSEGVTIGPGDIRFVTAPAKYLPDEAVREADAEKILGLATSRQVSRGAMLLWSDLRLDLMLSGPSSKIATGYRAVSVSPDGVGGISGALRPGDHVDILTTVTLPGGRETATLTLLQRVLVLLTGSAGSHTASGTQGAVTLMVLPTEAALITFAQAHGKLSLALRNPEDPDTPKNLPLIAMGQMLESAFRNSLQQERNRAVEVIRGGVSSLELSPP